MSFTAVVLEEFDPSFGAPVSRPRLSLDDFSSTDDFSLGGGSFADVSALAEAELGDFPQSDVDQADFSQTAFEQAAPDTDAPAADEPFAHPAADDAGPDADQGAAARNDAAERAFLDAAAALTAELAAARARGRVEFLDAFRAIFTAVTPELARRGFAEEAAKALADVFVATAHGPVEIAAAPEHVEALTPALERKGFGKDFVIKPDETLSELRVVARVGQGGCVDFNLSSALDACGVALDNAINAAKHETGR